MNGMQLVASVSPDSDMGMLGIIGGVIVTIVLIRSIAGILRTHAREKSRREIAAFIAEGSMTPEQGERLMRAGETRES